MLNSIITSFVLRKEDKFRVFKRVGDLDLWGRISKRMEEFLCRGA